MALIHETALELLNKVLGSKCFKFFVPQKIFVVAICLMCHTH